MSARLSWARARRMSPRSGFPFSNRGLRPAECRKAPGECRREANFHSQIGAYAPRNVGKRPANVAEADILLTSFLLYLKMQSDNIVCSL